MKDRAMNNSNLPWDPDLYQEFSSIQFNLGLMAIDRLKPAGAEKVLDIGCGTGLLAIDLARRLPEGSVTGVETSPGMAEMALANIKNSGAQNVTIMNIDALHIDFTDEFDAVFSNSAIHWIQDLETMYRLIHRALKPNGRVMIQTGIREMNPLIRTFVSVLSDERYRGYFSGIRLPWRFLTEDETRSILAGAGFSEIDLVLYPGRQEFENEKGLAGYLISAAMVPLMPHVPEKEKDEFTDYFVKTYIANNDNRLEVRSTRIFISALKK
jgi:trans-aconitate 2-methyltransferase